MEKTALVLLCLAGCCVPASNHIRKLLFVEAEMSWSEAQGYCREKHTDLATVRSQEEAEQLLNITGDSLSDTAWIGLYCDDTQNWQWSNSVDVIYYSNWKAELFCASVSSQGEWEVRVCNEKKAFMCYTETSNITERYTLIEELKTCTEAQQYCREHHTDLVSIKSASENEDLVKKAQGKPFWIGLFNNPWKWSHQGDNYTFQNWNTVEPNNMGGNENCVVLALRDSQYLARGKWNDQNCKLKRPFFCFDDHMVIGRVKFTAPRGMNLEDPKVSEAILEQIREHLSKSSPMDGVRLRWRKQDGEIFHKAEEEKEEEEEEEGCPKP